MIVVDASALVDVVLDQPAKPWVIDRMMGQKLAAPAHQPAGCLVTAGLRCACREAP